MKLNCWPGCLAYVVGTDIPDGAAGATVEVLRRAEDEIWFGCGPLWTCQPTAPLRGYDAETQELLHPDMEKIDILDVNLRPILPPAGTVSDEEVSELYEPSTKRTPQTA